MYTYYNAEKNTSGDIVSVGNVFLNSDKTQMKESSVMEVYDSSDPNTLEGFNQVATPADLLVEITDQVYTDDTYSTTVDYKSKGYALYRMTCTVYLQQYTLVNGEVKKTWKDLGKQVPWYLIKENGENLYIIYVKEKDGKYYIKYKEDLNLDAPRPESIFIKAVE